MRWRNVSVGHVSPEIDSAARKSRGKRAYSLSQSSCPRSRIIARQASEAMISLAP